MLLYLLTESNAYFLNALFYLNLNLYLHLLPDIGFQYFTAVWKACSKSKQIAKKFAQIFAQTSLMGIFRFSAFFNAHLGLFCKCFWTFAFAREGLFKNIFVFQFIFLTKNFELNFKCSNTLFNILTQVV